MPSITLELPVTDTVVSAGLHATNYADIQALLNGALDGSNVAASTVLSITSATLSGAAGLVLSGAGGNDTLNLSNTTAGTGITIGGDVNLYRSAASTLKTDDTFEAVGDIRSQAALRAQYGSATLVAMGDIGGSLPGILFGSGLDTNLYRSAADILATNDNFYIFGSGGAANPVLAFNRNSGSPRIEWGAGGGSATDAHLTRSASSILRLDNGSSGQAGLEFIEAASGDFAAGAVGTGRIYARDNGAGKTQIVVRFNTGAVQVLATEP